MTELLELDTVTVRGTPRELGRGVGEAFRARVRAFVDMRYAALASYFADRGHGGESAQVLAVGETSFGLFEAWDPAGHAEQCGIAEGAGVDPLRLFTAANMTDFRDAVLLSAPSGPPMAKVNDPIDQGCSSVMVPGSHTSSGEALVGQTWDLNPPDVAFVVAIKREPTEGPATWGVTVTGCLTLMGLNAHGLTVGTTNIKTYGSRPGVGYLSILHRAVRAKTAPEAKAVVAGAPHSGAHTYWIADAREQLEWEASPNGTFLRETTEGPVWRTNHVLAETHQAIEGERPGESSEARFARLGELLGSSGQDRGTLTAVFSDRSRGVHSINRYEEDDQGTATNAVFIASPAEAKAWACRGPADRGKWIELAF
ncbi:MAG: C45 family peptidase [Myxococcota bacterium]